MTSRHSLGDLDTQALTATCTRCGPGSKIRPIGKGWACATGRREAQRRYRQSHPDRQAATRKFNPSRHRLQGRKGGADICAICGPVESVPQGWGYMCPNRAAEMNWKNLPAAPVPLCPRCKSRHLDSLGACPECDTPLASYRGRPTTETPDESRGPVYRADLLESDCRESGLVERASFLGLAGDGEYDFDDPSLKTLGTWAPYSEKPPPVRPEYAAIFGGKR